MPYLSLLFALWSTLAEASCHSRNLAGCETSATAAQLATEDQFRARLWEAEHTKVNSIDRAASDAPRSAFTTFYHISLVPLAIVTAILAWLTRPKLEKEVIPLGFAPYMLKYLVVWSLAICADWLQGPYVYALYSSYGYSSSDIARLFVAGFGASMVFGVFVGVIADAWGRKRTAMAYCVFYTVSCITKHFSNYWVLMFGRVTGGIATSMLFSAFECWMVAEHKKRHGFSAALLRYMFSCMYAVQYLTAIVAGLVAQAVVDHAPLTKVSESPSIYFGGNTAPFDMSAGVLLIALPLIGILWGENYGDEGSGNALLSSFKAAGSALFKDYKISLLGMVVASFEGSMFAFVFNWTPTLDSGPTPLPHGLVFSAFMMACMSGSCFFSFFNPRVPPGTVLIPLTAGSALALLAAGMGVGTERQAACAFFSFLFFEAFVGIYFPAMGTLKSLLVPEEARAGVYNMYRVPLNAVVVGILLSSLSLKSCYWLCVGLLSLAAIGLVPLARTREANERDTDVERA